MAETNGRESASSDAYATTDDFERIFTEDMGALYLLSFLLTGSSDKAEECFAAGMKPQTEILCSRSGRVPGLDAPSFRLRSG